MNIDIATTFKVILVLLGIGVITSVFLALKSINTGKNLEFYRKRQELIEQGWRMVLFAFLLSLAGFLIFRFGEPIAYRYFPPSSTITRTPTITITTTVTLTPRETFTPTITLTLAQTYTPSIPGIVQTAIKTPVGVDTKAVFSAIQFSPQTKNSVVINTSDTFTVPITQMYGGYTYDKMVTGVQWTAIWLYEGNLICYETQSWNFSPGGAGYTDACNKQLTTDQWKPGEYEVQIFVGQTWKSSGRFTILSAQQPVNASPSASLTSQLPAVTQTPKPTSNP